MPTRPTDLRTAPTRILIVDDSEADRLLIARTLRRFRPATVDCGEAALGWIDENGLPDVVFTDHHMFGMDGMELLLELRNRYPTIVRVLLTGHADLELALTSVNEGNIFQLVSKTWPNQRMLQAAQAALRQSQLQRAERDVIRKTLTGAVASIGEALALANPVALGHTLRVAATVDLLAKRLDAPRPWEISMATQLSQLGTVHIPTVILERALLERDLKPWEEDLYVQAPERACHILARIPRLDGVREIIRWQNARFDGRTRGAPAGEALPLGARILHVAVAADRLEMQGLTREAALSALCQRRGTYDPNVLQALQELLSEAAVPTGFQLRSVPVSQLQAGMIFAQDVYTEDALLLTTKGTTASPGILGRIRGFAAAHGIQNALEMYTHTSRVGGLTASAGPPAVLARGPRSRKRMGPWRDEAF